MGKLRREGGPVEAAVSHAIQPLMERITKLKAKLQRAQGAQAAVQAPCGTSPCASKTNIAVHVIPAPATVGYFKVLPVPAPTIHVSANGKVHNTPQRLRSDK